MNIKIELESLINKQNLTKSQMDSVIEGAMQGTINDVQMAAFLALMQQKGATAIELSAAAETMAKHQLSIDLGDDIVDIVGTGGDGFNTFNISTASSFVVAASGIKVAKHGSTSVSSNSGSADLMQKAQIDINYSLSALRSSLDKHNLVFLFGPNFHPALKNVLNVRKSLNIKTIFNLLGPLLNPARPKRQVIGVYARELQLPIAKVLVSLGSKHAFVIHSKDGLDEISIAAKTHVLEAKAGKFREFTINPEAYGIKLKNLNTITVANTDESLKMILDLLKGNNSPAYDTVLLNSALLILVSGKCKTYDEALTIAENTLKSAKGYKLLQSMQKDRK